MSRRTEITVGDTYGRLTVLREVSPKLSGKHLQRCVECRCECGEVGVYRLYALRNGNTRSCGCLARESSRMPVTHGCSDLPEYRIWSGIKRRCNNAKDAAWPNYGGRGIRVCDRWNASFEAFLEDMGRRPSSAHSIDRFPDNDGNYEPGNCRWATSKEQMRNTRMNYLVFHDGETKCVAEWAEEYGFKPSVLYARLVKLGWTFEKSVSWPVFNRRKASRKASDPFYQVPRRERDAAWQREHILREQKRIALDRRELASCGDSLAATHRVNAIEFKSRADAALAEGWSWNGAVFRALRELGAVS